MNKMDSTVIERAPAAPNRIERLIDRAQGVTAIVLAGLALGGVGNALEGSFDTSAAEAQTPGALLRHDQDEAGQVQEYVKLIPSDANGNPVRLQKNTFVFLEQCDVNGHKKNRNVVAKAAVQPLGSCDIGSPVTVSEKEPLQGDWVDRSKVTQSVSKATRKNNHHFVFVEQEGGSASTPVTPGPAPTPTPAPNPTPTPEPGNPYASGNVGTDISWPQCGTANETPSGFDFGIVDVNDGLGYSTNPCLSTEAGNFPGNKLNLYVNTGWNDSSSHINPDSPHACTTGDENCLAYNYGYNAGLYAYDAASGEGITSATWWLDVESNATWSSDTVQNQNSLQGEHDALIAGGATTVGAYSTTVQWGDITGGWQNEWPSWGATTWQTAQEAQTYCSGHEFTGGPSELMQFTPTSELDEDVAC